MTFNSDANGRTGREMIRLKEKPFQAKQGIGCRTAGKEPGTFGQERERHCGRNMTGRGRNLYDERSWNQIWMVVYNMLRHIGLPIIVL